MIDFKYRGVLTDRKRLTKRLQNKGLSPPSAQRKATLFAGVATALISSDREDRDAELAGFFVPGRIEVLGKHTDYAGGRSMVAAAEQGFCLVAWPRDDDQVNVTDAANSESVEFKLDADLGATASQEAVPHGGHWSNYPATVVRRVVRNFPGAGRGADIAFASDLPPAAGMSSSSAMIVAMFFALDVANELAARDEYRQNIAGPADLAGYLATIENGRTFGSLQGDRGVGTFGGSEDHTAILCAKPNRVSQYAYCPVEFEQDIPVPENYTFAIGVSGVVAEKTGAARDKYNMASQLASAVAGLWRRETGRDDPHLAAALSSSPDARELLTTIIEAAPPGEFDPPALLARLEHFAIESGEIIPAAANALGLGDLKAFGRLVDRSQHTAERLLGNQVPQTAYLAAAAREHGAVAASAFGAGFGGGVWAMIEKDRAAAFLGDWADAYRQQFPGNAEASSFFTTAAGPAAFRVD